MKKCTSRVVVVLLVTVFVAAPVFADQWVKLGERTVNFKADTDEIDVGGSEGKFKRIKLKVEGGAVHFNQVVVVFGNNERFDVPITDNIPAGGETRRIDLPGEARNIKKIILKYKTHAGSYDKAIVTVMGMKD
jgi:hypothetical protein